MIKNDAFTQAAAPYRRELLVHCYRILGSADDAEDAVQETFLRAWRAYDRFEGRSSVRVWLYKIATNACLRAVEQRSRRALPSGLGGPSTDTVSEPQPEGPEVLWIQPLATDPAAIVAERAYVRLAFIAALQHLPARQRAALVLRDIAGLPATEVANILSTTSTAVHSAVARARDHLLRIGLRDDDISEPDDPRRRELLDRYVSAFQRADLDGLTAILHDDVVLEMPPLAAWFAGRESVLAFLSTHVLGSSDRLSFAEHTANAQAAFTVHHRDDDGVRALHAIHVLTVATGGISRIVVFLQRQVLLEFAASTT